MTTTIEEIPVAEADEIDFRSRVDEFLNAHCSRIGDEEAMIGEEDADVIARTKTFQASLAAAGLAALAYPTEFGGGGLSKHHQELFDQL